MKCSSKSPIRLHKSSTVRACARRSSALSLGEHLFDGVQIRTVGRQILQLRALRLNGLSHPVDLVRAQVVHHHHIPGVQLRREKLLRPGQERRPIDGAVQSQRSRETRLAQRTDKGRGLPVPLRRVPPAALAARASSVPQRHVRAGPGLVDEDQRWCAQARLLLAPVLALLSDLYALLLGGVEGLFFNVIPQRLSVLCMVTVLTRTPCSAAHWHSCTSV